MDVLDSYKIDLKNMRTDVAEYQIALDDAFFEAVEGTLVKSGKADAELKIRESGGAYVFTFHIKGTVHVPCDRCLDDMDVEIETERMLTVKLGDEYADEGDMMILPYEDAILNVAWIIYEFIVLEVPLTHVHEPGHCNVEMMEALPAPPVTPPVFFVVSVVFLISLPVFSFSSLIFSDAILPCEYCSYC